MDDEEVLTAYHEAGHATVGFALGGIVESIQLGGEHPIVGVSQFGECRIAWNAISQASDSQLQRELATVLAGPAAEIVYLGETLELVAMKPWKQDLDTAWSLVGSIVSSESEKRKMLNQIICQLQHIIARDRYWPAVAGLADELLAHEFLEQEAIEEILSFWINRY